MATAAVTITGTSANPVLNFTVPQGEKGDPGGFNTGTLLGSSDLNTITTPGLYRQDNGTQGSFALNYPLGGVAGVLEVLVAASTSSIIQRFTVHSGPAGSGNGRMIYVRRGDSGTFQAWQAFRSSRVDQTAGRAIYQWDDLNNREQLTYGDTGWRDISGLLINGWSSTSTRIRRFGFNVAIIGTLDNTVSSSDHFIAQSSIAGFKPSSGALGAAYGNDLSRTTRSVGFDYADLFITSGLNPRTSWNLSASYMTDSAWPTTLPGTAIGSIPNV